MPALQGGLADPVMGAQSVFRSVMDAMARPGSIRALAPAVTPPAPLSLAAGAVACTLMDIDTPVWLDPPLAGRRDVRDWLTFHTGAPLATEPRDASFALVCDPAGMPALADFAQGSQDYPDRSATLILQIASLAGGTPLTLRGPGVKGRIRIAPQGLPADFAAQWADNRKRFPRGVDLILAAGDELVCLPRSARLTAEG